MSWFLLYAVAVSGLAISLGIMALFYLYRTADAVRQLREDMTLLHRGFDIMADEARRVNHHARSANAHREAA